MKDPDLQHHGDSAVMLGLGWFTTLNLSVIALRTLPRGFDNLTAGQDLDDDLNRYEPASTW